jgi:predicted dehydrogenase
VRLVHDGVIGKVKEAHSWSGKAWGDSAPMPAPSDPPKSLNWDLWLGVCASRPYIGGEWYCPANWRKRLDFGVGTFGDMGCHIFDPAFGAMGLTSPVSVRSEGSAPSGHSWATDALIHYVFPETPYSVPGQLPVTWYDGNRRPPADVVALIEGTELPDQGSIIVGTEGVMLIPHVAAPALFPKAKFAGLKHPEVGRANHWHEFIDAVRGKGATSAPFSYAGPLTESVLLGSVATRFPNTTLQWNAKHLRFDNEKEANKFVRRKYREGWVFPGL